MRGTKLGWLQVDKKEEKKSFVHRQDKLIKVHTRLVLNEQVESKAWRNELRSRIEHHGIIESNHKIDMAMSMKVMEFFDYMEPWEKKKLTLNNEESYFAF